ncbi:MAG: XRE family transcriptional regulator [Bacteroidales bacterium]|nr:MAG: XRE family transcriptional regulator [Bacteroidales bacterium]
MSENERLKEIRKLLNFTQREFSDALDIKQGSYSDVERGKAGISAVLLKNLIRRFRINPLWLCEGEGEMFIDTSSGISISPNQINLSNKGKSSPKEADNELNTIQLEQIKHLEQQQENLENLKSIIDFLKKEE